MRYLTVILILLSSAVYAQQPVIDDLGYEVKTGQVNKIVALSPHLAEMVFTAGAGDKLIATVDHADYPEAAKSIPSLGPYNAWGYEQVLALKPDLVLIWLTANGPHVAERLKQLGLNVYVSEPRDFKTIARTILDIGQLAGTQAIANQHASTFMQAIRHLEIENREKSELSVFYQVWQKPLYTINGDQMISKVIDLCGGRNIFTGLTSLAPVVSFEALLAENPDVIIGGARPAEKQHWLEHWQNWNSLKAVASNNLYFINPDLLNRQTTRILQGARQLCSVLNKARREQLEPQNNE